MSAKRSGSDLVSSGLLLPFWRHLDEDERVQKVRLDARRRKVCAVRLEKNDAHDIVAYVPLSL